MNVSIQFRPIVKEYYFTSIANTPQFESWLATTLGLNQLSLAMI